MEQTICNRCRKEIKRGIRTYGGEPFPPYYDLLIHKYDPSGALISRAHYHLDEECYKEFEEFINSDRQGKISGHGYVIGKKDDTQNETAYVVGERVMPIPNTTTIGSMLKNNKSVMSIGNAHIYTTKVFNKFQKYMWKKTFGIEIKEVEKFERDRNN